jgi:hypothetical protein
MAQVYVPIQTVTVGSGGSASIEFTNIPQTYTDLCVLLSTRQSPASTQDTTWIKDINGVTGSFTDRVLRGDGAGASSFVPSETPLYIGQSPCANATANTFADHCVYIPNYTSSNNKSISIDSVQETNAATAYMGFTAGLWSNTSAITSIKFEPNSGTFVQYSTATLYGIGGTRATGGTITADSTYTYHTFTSTGSFTALENIKGAEALVIAGGGGGGKNFGGGGGAGGLLYTNGQLLNAGNSYTIAVGAGGSGHTATWTPIATNGSNSSFGSNVATGGGYGGGFNGSVYFGGGSGGSGGGGSYDSVGAAGTSGQGNTGGNGGTITGGETGGGGGAGAAGANGSSGNAGSGGNGSSTYSAWGYITSTGQNIGGTYWYAGGGGGGAGNGNRGSGGNGGGGLGGPNTGVGNANAGTAGTANTGGGGGGGSWYSGNGANGGSGVVIIRYPN